MAEGCTIDVITWESGSTSTLNARSLGSLPSAQPHRWLGASWHPDFGGLLAAICQAEVRLVLCHEVEQLTQLSRILPPSCVGAPCIRASEPCRSVQCHVAWVGTASSSVRHGASRASGSGQSVGAARAAPAAAAASDLLTLVVGWGPELELISWPAAALRSAAVAAAEAVLNEAFGNGGVRGGGGVSSQSPPLVPIIRRTLLLGVPGPLCAVSLGPYGSVLATTEADLALSYPAAPAGTAAAAAAAAEAAAEEERQAGAADTAGRWVHPPQQRGQKEGEQEGQQQGEQNGQQQQQQRQQGRSQQQATEVIDLRGWRPDGGASRAQLGSGGAGGGALANLFNISAGQALGELEHDVGGSGWQGARVGTRGTGTATMEAAAAVPRRLLLTSYDSDAPSENTDMRAACPLHRPSETPAVAAGSALAASASALCVVWPGGLARAASTPDCSGTTARVTVPCGTRARPPAAEPSADGDLDGFCSLAPLHLPRPDLLTCCGGLVLAASSLGQPTVIAFRLAPDGGLTRLACLTPAWPPDVVAAGRGRLRGLAAVWTPPSAGSAAAATPAAFAGGGGGGGGGGAPPAVATSARGREGGHRAAARDVVRDVMLVALVGEMEQPPAGGGIFGFGRSGRAAGQKMARLVASAHPLPSQLAACAFDDAAAAAAVVAPPLSSSTEAGEAATDAAAPFAASVKAEGLAPSAGVECGSRLAVLASPSAADAIAAAVVGQLAELLAGFRRHVDERLDSMEGSFRAMADRLDALEAALAQQQRP